MRPFLLPFKKTSDAKSRKTNSFRVRQKGVVFNILNILTTRGKMMKRKLTKGVLSCASGLLVALSMLSSPVIAGNGDTLKAVKERGSLLCFRP